MSKYWSASTNSIWCSNVCAVNQMPEDVVLLTDAEFAELMEKQAQGYRIVHNSSTGKPQAIAQTCETCTYIPHELVKYYVDEAQFSVDSLAKAINYGLLWLCIELFEDTADVDASVGVGGSIANYHDAVRHIIAKTGTGSIVLQSKAQTCAKNNDSAWVYVDYTGDGSITVQISRDGGTTFTTCTHDALTDISAQPAGTGMVCKLTLTGAVTLKNIAWGAK